MSKPSVFREQRYEETERIIDAVKAKSVLWDENDPQRRDLMAVGDAWAAIGDQLNMSPQDVKYKFKMIKDIYRRNRRTVLMKQLQNGCIHEVRWKPYHQLSFLDPYMTFDIDGSFCTLPEPDTEGVILDSNAEPQAKVIKIKRIKPHPRPIVRNLLPKKNPLNDNIVQNIAKTTLSTVQDVKVAVEEIITKVNEKQDREALFGHYIAESLRQMPPETRSVAKVMINKVICDLENTTFSCQTNGAVQ